MPDLTNLIERIKRADASEQRRWTPRLVPRPQVACWPWRLRESSDEHPIGGACVSCGRDVAVLPRFRNHDPLCLYCALDTGLLPPVEIELDGTPLHEAAAAPRENSHDT